MKTTLVGFVGALLCAPVLAQAHVTTPFGADAKEGDTALLSFGALTNQRFVMLDKSHATGKARSITRFAYRVDNRWHASRTRTWTKVSLSLAHASYDKATQIGSASTVFDSKWSWPALDGQPALQPASWGGAKSLLSYTLSKPWMYNGKDSMLLDYNFRTPKHSWWGSLAYPLDAVDMVGNRKAATNTVPTLPPRCYDSSDSLPAFASGSMETVQSATPPSVSLKISSYFTARNNPVLYLVGLGGSEQGVSAGALCNKLHVDLSQPHLMVTKPAPKNQFGQTSHTLTATWSPLLDDVWVQAAWADSKSGYLRLMHGMKFSPLEPLKATAKVAQTTVFTGSVSSLAWSSTSVPVTRYDFK